MRTEFLFGERKGFWKWMEGRREEWREGGKEARKEAGKEEGEGEKGKERREEETQRGASSKQRQNHPPFPQPPQL